MSLIAKITGIYDAAPLKSLLVPEWDETIYFKSLTGLEFDTVREMVGAEATGSRHNAQIIVLKSLDKAGVRLFKNADVDALSEKGYLATIGRIASAMSVVSSPEQAAKN